MHRRLNMNISICASEGCDVSGKTPFELMMTQAQEMAKAMNPALASFAPKEFEQLWPTMPKDMMEMMFGPIVTIKSEVSEETKEVMSGRMWKEDEDKIEITAGPKSQASEFEKAIDESIQRSKNNREEKVLMKNREECKNGGGLNDQIQNLPPDGVTVTDLMMINEIAGTDGAIPPDQLP